MIFLSVLRTEQSQTTYFLESTFIRLGCIIAINIGCPIILLFFSDNQTQDRVLNCSMNNSSGAKAMNALQL